MNMFEKGKKKIAEAPEPVVVEPVEVEEAEPDREVVPVEEIEVAVSGGVPARAVGKALGKQTRSATRSDRLATELYLRRLGPEKAAEVVAEMLEAVIVRPKQVKNGSTGRWDTVEIKEPDWKTRGVALKFMADVHGWLFNIPKTELTIGAVMLGSAKEIEAMSPQQALAELPNAIRALKDIDPALIEEAVVES